MESYKDFLNNSIHDNDSVVYLKRTRTGDSTFRKCLYKGTVSGFTNCKVKITSESGTEYQIIPEDIVVIKS